MKRNSSTYVSTQFPIWEKIYFEENSDLFWENIKIVQIKNLVFVFANIYLENNKTYYIIDLELESMKKCESEYEEVFYPIWDGKKTIYLYRFDSSPYSDWRYQLIEFNIETETWAQVQFKGVAPKRRSETFNSFYHHNSSKIYFFGGLQMYPGDNTGNFIYSFNCLNNEWSIENIKFPTNNPNTPYLSNRSGIASVLTQSDKLFIIGGKELENSFFVEGSETLKGKYNMIFR
jgi:hypothetical protein